MSEPPPWTGPPPDDSARLTPYGQSQQPPAPTPGTPGLYPPPAVPQLNIRGLRAATYLYPIGSIPAHLAASRAAQALGAGNWQLAAAEAANAEILARRAIRVAWAWGLVALLIILGSVAIALAVA